MQTATPTDTSAQSDPDATIIINALTSSAAKSTTPNDFCQKLFEAAHNLLPPSSPTLTYNTVPALESETTNEPHIPATDPAEPFCQKQDTDTEIHATPPLSQVQDTKNAASYHAF